MFSKSEEVELPLYSHGKVPAFDALTPTKTNTSEVVNFPEPQYTKLGIIFSLLAPLAYVVTSCVAKLIPGVPPIQMLFLRSVLTTPPFFAYFHYTNRLNELRSHVTNRILIVSGFFVAMSALTFYIAMLTLSVTDVYTIFSTLAIINGILGALLLKEPYSHQEKLLGVIGFLGVLLVVRPPFLFGGETATASNSTGGFSHFVAGLLGLLSAIAFSLYQISVKAINTGIDPLVISFFTNLNTIIWYALYFIFIGEYQSMSISEYFGCFVFGVAFIWGLVMVSYALKYSSMSMIGVLGYSQLIFSLVVDILFFADFPSFLTIVGAVLIVGSCLYLIRTQSK